MSGAADRRDLRERLAALDAGRRDALLARLRAGAAPRAGSHPLTSTQAGIWIFEQLHPETSAYNNPAAVGLRGRLDQDALRAALGAVQAKHDALRTRYPDDAEEPYAVVEPHADLPFAFEDLSAASDADREARRRAVAEAHTPFDLERGPVWRVLLLRLDAETHVLVVTFHHIVSDGWSLGIFFRDLKAAYEAGEAGRDPRLQPPPLAYAELMRRRRDALSPGRRAELTEYWKTALSGVDQLVRLPYDHPPDGVSWEGGTVPILVPADLAAALEARAAATGGSPFAALLAVFAALLQACSSQTRFAIAVPVAGRDDPRTHDAIGCFLNTVPVVAEVPSGTTLDDLLTRTRAALQQSMVHSQLPFAEIAAAVSAGRAQSKRPVSNVMLVQNNAPLEALRIGGLSIERYPIPVVSVKYDWAIVLGRSAAGYTGELEYARRLFDESTVERAAAAFVALARALAYEPDSAAADVAARSLR